MKATRLMWAALWVLPACGDDGPDKGADVSGGGGEGEGEGEGEAPSPGEGEGEGEGGGGLRRVCDPGETQQCACPGETLGAQVCREDLAGWSPCECIGDAPTSLACLPGEAQDCTCDTGRHGKRPCLADGSNWGGCVCAEGPTCEDQCERGAIECAADSAGYRFCRDNDSDGCVEWTPQLPCPDGLRCFQGDCTPLEDICEDACDLGALRCAGNGGQECVDVEGCAAWSLPIACADVEQCAEGLCVVRQTGDECESHEQCGVDLGICDFGECIQPYGRLWEVTVAAAHVGEAVGDLFDDPDPGVVITVGDEDFATEIAHNERSPMWFQSFDIFIRRGDPFRWRLFDADLLGEERVGAWEFADGVPIGVLRASLASGIADDGESFVTLWFFPASPPEDG